MRTVLLAQSGIRIAARIPVSVRARRDSRRDRRVSHYVHQSRCVSLEHFPFPSKALTKMCVCVCTCACVCVCASRLIYLQIALTSTYIDYMPGDVRRRVYEGAFQMRRTDEFLDYYSYVCAWSILFICKGMNSVVKNFPFFVSFRAIGWNFMSNCRSRLMNPTLKVLSA